MIVKELILNLPIMTICRFALSVGYGRLPIYKTQFENNVIRSGGRGFVKKVTKCDIGGRRIRAKCGITLLKKLYNGFPIHIYLLNSSLQYFETSLKLIIQMNYRIKDLGRHRE